MAELPSAALLRLLHLTSPALPIGSFHFSQGLEYAVEAGWVTDETSAGDWIAGMAEASFASLDLPVLVRLHSAWWREDDVAIRHWGDWLLASRETSEARAEDRHMGSALLKVLAELQVPIAESSRALPVPYASAFALACARWQIDAGATAQAFAWAWAETQVIAAVKLVPLGQSAGQRLLHRLTPLLAGHATHALHMHDDDIGIATVMQAVAGARHETQYTRLFRS